MANGALQTVVAVVEQEDHHRRLAGAYTLLYLILLPDRDRQDEVEDALRRRVEYSERVVERIPDASRFRDYLVRAYNDYSRFLVERVDVENRDHEKSKRLAQKARDVRLESAVGH